MRTTDVKFASARRVGTLEQEVADLRRALASQVELVVGLRSLVAPPPGEMEFRQHVEAQATAESPSVPSVRQVAGGDM